MPAPKNNEFWKLRSKHGRDAIFTEPEKMKEAAGEYFQWCVDNPLKEEVLQKVKVNRDEEEIRHETVSKLRVFQLTGLCIYLGVNEKYFAQFESELTTKKKFTLEQVQGFSNVITHIREVIFTQKFEGAAAGFFNANIIARDLGLADKKQLDHTTRGESITGMRIVDGKK